MGALGLTTPDITSAANPRIKHLVELRDRRARDRDSLFVVEGERHIGQAIESGLAPIEVYFDGSRFPDPPFPAGSVFSVDAAALDRASYRGRSQGVIAVFEQFELTLDRISPTPEPLVLVVEGIEKPGNLGALLRTADAVGADALIAVDPSTDPFNPNVIRASTGSVFAVLLAVSTIAETSAWLRRHRIRLVAADPEAAVTFWETDLTGPIALLVGAEHAGLTADARSAADVTVSIPMQGKTDSLNTSITAALLAYETRRQRRPSD